jgi:O-antigen ligase
VQTTFSNKLFYCLLVILFLLPLPLGANRPWAWSVFQMLIFALTFACVYHFRAKPLLGMLAYHRILYFWFALIILASLQIIALPSGIVGLLSPNADLLQNSAGASRFYLSLDIGQSVISYFKLLAYFCFFCCVLMLVTDEKRIKWLLMTMVAAGTLQAVYGSFEVLLGLEKSLVFGLDVGNAATGSFVYKNHYANFLMMCASAGIGLLVISLQKNRNASPKDMLRAFVSTMLSSKAIIRISIAIMVIGLVMSRSRMGNTAFFVAMTVIGFVSLYLIKNKSKGLTILVISMFIIDLFIVSAYFGLEKVQERLVQTSLQQESRDEVVRDASRMIFDYPLLGTGGGSFYSSFPQYQSSEVHSFYDHTHNDYLQMAIEYGLPAFIIMAGMTLFLSYKALRPMYRRQNSVFKGASFACSMAVLGMLVHMTVDFPLQAFANATYFCVFLALAMVINSLKLKRKRRGTS